MPRTGTTQVGDGVRRMLGVSDIQDRFNVTEPVARRLYDHFGSGESIGEASRDDLLDVEGIGTKTADHIYTTCWVARNCPEGALVPTVPIEDYDGEGVAIVRDGGRFYTPDEVR